MITLLNADNTFIRKLACWSRNETDVIVQAAKTQPAVHPGPRCAWGTFISECNVVANPSHFALIDYSEDATSPTEVRVRLLLSRTPTYVR